MMSAKARRVSDGETLRSIVGRTTAQLRSGVTDGIVRPAVTTRFIGMQRAQSEFVQYDRVFRFQCDESRERGGTGKYPSPMRYFLSSVGFCLQVWYAKGAALVGCVMDDVIIAVETELDMRGEHKVAGVPSGPERLAVESYVRSSDASDCVIRAVQEADERCPVLDVLGRAMTVHERVWVNGALELDRLLGRSVRGHDS